MGSPFVSDLPFPGRPLQLPATRPAMLKIQDYLQQGGAQKKTAANLFTSLSGFARSAHKAIRPI